MKNDPTTDDMAARLAAAEKSRDQAFAERNALRSERIALTERLAAAEEERDRAKRDSRINAEYGHTAALRMNRIRSLTETALRAPSDHDVADLARAVADECNVPMEAELERLLAAEARAEKAEEDAAYWRTSSDDYRRLLAVEESRHLSAKNALAAAEKRAEEAEAKASETDHWRVKARCYGDIVHGCSPALAAAGFPVDSSQHDGAVGGIARSVSALAETLASERAARVAAERERDEARSSEEWLAFASMREERDAAASDAAFRLELLRAVVATGTKDPRLDARIAEEVGR